MVFNKLAAKKPTTLKKYVKETNVIKPTIAQKILSFAKNLIN